MKEILLSHARRYPLLEPQDLVKLLYQSEFGGGHMISDPQSSLRRLTEEFQSISHDPGRPLTEEIGGGLLRVDLHALAPETIPLARLNEIFVRSAAEVRGTKAHFIHKIDLLLRLAAAGRLPFGEMSLRAYLAGYYRAGLPAVSHSSTYKKAYDPSYRIVCRDLFIAEIL